MIIWNENKKPSSCKKIDFEITKVQFIYLNIGKHIFFIASYVSNFYSLETNLGVFSGRQINSRQNIFSIKTMTEAFFVLENEIHQDKSQFK